MFIPDSRVVLYNSYSYCMIEKNIKDGLDYILSTGFENGSFGLKIKCQNLSCTIGTFFCYKTQKKEEI